MALRETKSKELARYRREFPFTQKVNFLNHASFGPIPLRALKKTMEYYDALTLKKFVYMDKLTFEMMDQIRIYLAKMVNAKPKEIGLVPNTSYGLNIVANGLDFKYGDKVIVKDPEGFYPDMLGTIQSEAWSDGYDCAVFDGYKVKTKVGVRVINTKDMQLTA